MLRKIDRFQSPPNGRQSLLLFALAAFVPMVVFGAFLIVQLGQQYRDISERRISGMPQTLSALVDEDFTAARRLAETLALSPSLDDNNFKAFHELAMRTLQANRNLLSIRLTDVETGEHLVDTRLPSGEIRDVDKLSLAQIREAIDLAKPVIFGLQTAPPGMDQAFIPVHAPVIRNGLTNLVVSLSLSPRALSEIFAASGFPETWTGVVIDDSGSIVGRNRTPERFIGDKVTPSLASQLQGGAAGLFVARNKEGTKIYTAFARSPVSGWTVLVGAPAGAITAPMRDSLLTVVLAGVLALMVGTFLSYQVGRAIYRARLWEVQTSRDLETVLADRTRTLQTREEQLRLITDSLPVLLSYIDTGLQLRYVNQRHEEWFRRPAAEMVDKHIREVIADEDVFDICEPYMRAALAGEASDYEVTERFPDGKRRRIHVRYLPIRDVDGNIPGFLTLVEDVTSQRRIEEQLLQSQRLQAVGQLTGGVAHDFNNLLSVIRGNIEFLQEKFGGDPHFDAVTRATRHGGDLTQRLLVFARQRPLTTKPVDVAALVSGMQGTLRRVLGETIEVATHSADDLWPVLADAGQIESAILNLAINASDAMPDGGRVTMACENARLDSAYVAANPEATEGEYVVITVGDSGIGMPPEVLERAFEPFFTTKDAVVSNGLGLSIVYGFVEQFGGHVRIYSQAGRGTKVALYLPRAQDGNVEAGVVGIEEEPLGKGEIVLVLEDDADVRALTVRTLEALGYKAVGAENAEHGRGLLKTLSRLHAMVSDVVLPGGVSGPQFAEEVLLKFPDVKLLFMSGYTARVAAERSPLLQKGTILTKPFHREDLARALYAVLHSEG